jgi:hypothetical protein
VFRWAFMAISFAWLFFLFVKPLEKVVQVLPLFFIVLKRFPLFVDVVFL